MNEQHEHPGSETPHRHDEKDEMTTHGASHQVGGSEQTMHLREEELSARKDTVETGRVSIDKEVVSEQRTMDVPVSRDEVLIERHPVNRTPSDEPIGEGTTMNVPLYEEQVDVQKRPVVYEEVGIGKRAVQDTQQVSAEVRREEARIENEGDVQVRRDA
jgi:uncharacterized protein (TIGR02271 family)